MPNEARATSTLQGSDDSYLARQSLDPKIEKQREIETKEVTGVFRCMEPVGGSVTLSYRKYPGEQIKTYTFNDGETYSIPLGLARHLNTGCAWPVHKNAIDPATDKSKSEVGKWIHRFSFSSTEFSGETINV